MDMCERIKNGKVGFYRFSPYIGLSIVLLVHISGINKLKVPTILYDEAGYWISAAHFAGKDWHGVTSVMSYFSYGIGLFLSLFMRMGKTPIITYHMVMIFNVMLVIACYFLAYRICQYLFPTMEKIYWVMICAVCMMFPTFIMNSQIAWSEHYLSCLFWLEIYLLMRILKKPGFINCGFYVISICYSYMVHQRTIVVLLLSIIIIANLTYLGKIKYKHVFMMLTVFAVMIIVHFLLKSDIQNNVWNTFDSQVKAVKENDYAGRIEILLFCIKNEGVKTVFRSFIGKLFYFIIATAGVGIFVFGDFIEKVTKLFKRRKLEDRERLTVYIFLIFLGIMLFNVVMNMEDGISTVLYSTLVYGRYMEWAVPPLLLICLGNLISNKYSASFYMKGSAFILLLSISVYFFYQTASFEKWMTSCVGGVTWFYDRIDGDKSTYVLLAAQVILLLLLALMWMIKKKKICALAVIALYFIFIGTYLRKEIVYNIQGNNQGMISVADSILEVDENIPVYYVVKNKGDSSNVSLLTLQYLLEDYKMAYVQESDLKIMTEPYYLLVSDYSYEMYPDYVVVESSNPVMRLLVNRNQEDLIQKFVEEGNIAARLEMD